MIMMRAIRFCVLALACHAEGSKSRSIRGRSLSGNDQQGQGPPDQGSGWGGAWFGGGEDHGGPEGSFDGNGTPPMDGPWNDGNSTFDGNGTFGPGGWPPMDGPWYDGNFTLDGNYTFGAGPCNGTPPMDGPWHDGNSTFGPGDWNGNNDDDVFKNATEGMMSKAFGGANWTQGGDWMDGNSTRPSGGWDHHHGPQGGGMFGSAPPGAGQAMGPFIPSWISSITYGGLDCPVSGTSTSNGPACASNPKGDEGVWVCRSLTNPFTGESESLSVCADSNQTIEAVDSCGCCGGSCPEVCQCNCTTPFGEDGVRVAMNVTKMGDGPTEVCIGSKIAVGLVGGVFSCVANCSAPMETPPPFMMMPGGHN